MFYCSQLFLNALASLGPMLESELNESSIFSRFCQLLSDIASDCLNSVTLVDNISSQHW